MKLAIIGSGSLVDYPNTISYVETVLSLYHPELVLLVPNRRLNRLVGSVCAERGILVKAMKMPQPHWLGKASQSMRKDAVRRIQAKFISERADKVVYFKTENGAGVAFKNIVDMAKALNKLLECKM